MKQLHRLRLAALTLLVFGCAAPPARGPGGGVDYHEPGAPPPTNSLPAVSPDGRWIAFVSKRDGTDDVYVMGADGRGERRVTRGGGQVARWTPDGRALRFVRGGPDSGRVYVAGPDGGTPREVAHVSGRNPVLSPDGKWAAYLVGPWTSTALWVARADGSEAHAVAGGGRTTAWNAAWSPDGGRLAYTYGDSSRALQVHTVNRDGTGDRALTHMSETEGSAQMPAWSPDGQIVAVQVSHHKTHTGYIWIVDAATGEARRLAPHADGLMDEVPAWFPDGRRIAFQSNRSGTMQIWVMDADGSNPRLVTGRP